MKYPLEFRLTVLSAIEKQLEKDVYNTESGRRSRDWNNNNFFNPLKRKITDEITEKEKTEKENAKFTISVMQPTEKDYFIKRIKSHTLVCGDGWANGKVGFFHDFDNNCLYRFIEDEAGRMGRDYTEADRNLPVLICGFVAWLIKYWGTDTQNIYADYLQAKLNQYKTEHKNDADVFKRDLEREFYDQYRTKEEQWVKQSEAIFDFISEQEVNEIKKYVKYYFEYVDSFSNPLAIDEYTQESDIIKNVDLRAIYFAIKHTTRDYPPNSNIRNQYTSIQIINDLRRIEQHHQEKPDKCISYFFEKYFTKRQIIKTPTVFVECLKLLIDNNNTFMIMLLDKYKFPCTETQKQFALKLNEARKQFRVPEPSQLKAYTNTIPQQSETKTDKANTQRQIDVERLKPYFVSTFKGMGNGNINHFSTMIEELRTDHVPKRFAQIAWMIYDSDKMSDRKPNAFAIWYNIFCECVGCDKRTYKPSQLTPIPDNLTKLFNYLT